MAEEEGAACVEKLVVVVDAAGEQVASKVPLGVILEPHWQVESCAGLYGEH